MKKALLVLLLIIVCGLAALLLTMTPATLPAGEPPTLELPAAKPPAAMKLAALKAGTMNSLAAFAYRGGSLLEQRQFGMGGILVQHPKGWLLFDTGFGRKVEEHTELISPLMRATSTITQELPVADQLQAANIDPARLRGVVLTHAHWDHVSGLDDMPGVPVWVTQPEMEFIGSGHDAVKVAASLKDINYQVYDFEDDAYLGFERSYDVFDDGSVVIVPAPGHTPGSVIVFIATPDDKRYALVGDIVWQMEGIRIPAERPWLPRRMVDLDAAQNRALIVQLHNLQRALPDLIIVPAHDRRVWDNLPGL